MARSQSANATKSEGRYSVGRNPTRPGSLPPEGKVGKLGKQDIRHGLVDDQNPAFRGQKQVVAINMRTDALEYEYAQNRLSEEAYRAGRLYQRVLERSGGRPTGGGQWQDGSRGDPVVARDNGILRALETARAAQDMIFSILPTIGVRSANVLRMVLLDRRTIEDVAKAFYGAPTRSQIDHYRLTFRESLQAIADLWAQTATPR